MLEAAFADRQGQTPQDVERRRRMADALMRGGHGGGAPKSGLELAGRLAMTLMGQYQDAKADKQDFANQTSANKLLADTLLGGSGGGADNRYTMADTGGGASAPSSGPRGSSTNVSDPNIFNTFMATVKEGGVTNPYGLAAIAATGKHESGFSPKNVYGNWADPSESGRQLTAGGAMSWNGPRYEAMKQFVAANGGDPNRPDPRLQAQYFLKEDPQLIAALNQAKSPEEAQTLMNNAWRFAGYNRHGGEAARRMSTARGFAPQFAGGQQAPTQVASLDPAAGMGQDTITVPPREQVAGPQNNYPEQGNVAPVDWTDQASLSVAPGMQFAGGQGGIMPPGQPGEIKRGPDGQTYQYAETTGMAGATDNQGWIPTSQSAGGIMAQPMPQGAPQPQAPNQAISDELLRKNDLALGGIMAPQGTPQPQGAALGGQFPDAPSPDRAPIPDQSQQFPPAPSAQPDRRAMIAQLLGNPYTAEAGQQLLMQEYKRQQEANDPANQLDMEYKRAQIKKLSAADDGTDYKVVNNRLVKTTKDGQVVDVTPEVPGAKGGFRFEGSSVEAQALNGLMDSGTLTPDQAQQLAAGKTITDPQTGAIVFLTPRGIFSQPAEGGAATPVGGDAPAGPATTAPSAPAGGAPASGANPGIIPLTEGKPGKLATEGERRNRSLYSVVQPELKVVEDNYAALSDPKNQAFAMMPFNEYMTTKEYQQAANSLQTIVTSYLYSVSGATATPDEVKKQTDILTPRPGEKKESIENKLKRVRTMVDAIRQSGGNWTPPETAPVEKKRMKFNPETGDLE